jgi:hypothetical protein
MDKNNDTQQNDYDDYARFCLHLAAKLPDRSSRLVLREMAAAWLTLATAVTPSFAEDR